MCNQAVNNYALECVPECHKTQEMYDQVANAKLSTKLFLNALRLKKYLMKLLIKCFLHLILFPIDIRPKKFVTEFFPRSFHANILL